MAGGRKFIGEYLVERGIISKSQLEEAVKESKKTNKRVGEILVKRGFATEEDIAKGLSEQLGFTFLDLSTYQVEAKALALVPGEVAARLRVIPVFKIGDSLTVAMTNPLDVSAIDELEQLTGGLRITPVLATPTGIKDAIAKYYKEVARARAQAAGPPAAAAAGPAGAPGMPGAPAPVPAAAPGAAPREVPEALLKEATQASVINIVNKLIEEAVDSDASDIHLEPEEDEFHARFRIDGVLHEVEAPPKKLQRAVTSRIKIMAEMDIAQSRLPQDGRIQMKILEREVDLRIATFPTIYGEHVSIRILDKSQGIIGLDKLGFQEDDLKEFKEIIKRPYGFILITGPTGSGKSTTLYAALNKINDLKKNIITLEDPVEYTIPRIHQSQVNVKAGLTFATGLRSIVRLDPDIIMIGEIRDRETADIAIHSSLTGHLVFSTLHTNDAASCPTRLIDIGVEPYMIASSLIGVVAQRLVRKLCPKCKKEYKPSREELSLLEKTGAGRPKGSTFYKSAGCRQCRNMGYKGRTGIYELLIPDAGLKELIAKKAPAYEIRKLAQSRGMRTLQEDGLAKVGQGITSLSEVLRVTEEA